MHNIRLTAQEIWRFLASAPVGRIATHDHERGVSSLTPLFFVATNQRIYFVTQPGRKLEQMRRYPHGIGLQCDQLRDGAWLSAFVWGNYRDVGIGAEYTQVTLLLAQKYGSGFVKQVRDQARKAIQGGPMEILRSIRGATCGCIDVERIGGRAWFDSGDH